jgi:hypothetical protein
MVIFLQADELKIGFLEALADAGKIVVLRKCSFLGTQRCSNTVAFSSAGNTIKLLVYHVVLFPAALISIQSTELFGEAPLIIECKRFL